MGGATPQSFSPPEPSSIASLTTDRFLTIIAIIISVVLAFVGFTKVFPLWLNMLVYLLALAFGLWGGWRWETAYKWSRSKKLWVSVLVILAYCVVMLIPIKRQYERETSTRVTFKDSQHLTWVRRRIITYDLAKFREFLNDLGIPVVEEVPPILVANSGLGMGFPKGLALYRADLSIGKDLITDRRAVTEIYANYMMEVVLVGKAAIRTHYIGDVALVQLYGDGFAQYFVQSYWGGQLPKRSWLTAQIFWHMRDKLGAKFTDKLAAATLNTIADDPAAKARDMDAYLVRAIMIGDSVVESQCDRWSDIRTSLVESGIRDSVISSQDLSNASISCSFGNK